MRRLIVGVATVGVVAIGSAAPAAALDAGAVSASSTYSGNSSCFEPPGDFATTAELTGTVTASGQTYLGPVRVEATGSYIQGPCSVRDPGILQAFLDEGTVSGQNALGTVAGTCSGGSFVIGPVAGLLPVPEPHLRGQFSLSCNVSVNGAALQGLLIEAELVGPGASQVGVYTIEPL